MQNAKRTIDSGCWCLGAFYSGTLQPVYGEDLQWVVWNAAYSCCFFFFSSRRRHTRFDCDWSSDVCSSDLNSHPARDRLNSEEVLKIEGGQVKVEVPAGGVRIVELK